MRYAIFGALSLTGIYIMEQIHSWILMWVLYLVLVLVFCALRVTSKPAKLLNVNRRLHHATAQVGQPVQVDITVNWQTVHGPGWVCVQDVIPVQLTSLRPCGELSTLGENDATTFSYTVVGQRRGLYTLGPLLITLGDYFGIARASASGGDVSYLTIHPRIVSVPELRLPSNRPIGDATSMNRIYEDATRIVGVREYLPGDTLSKIHWKTTARTGNLVSKLCEPSTSVEVNILLNLHDGDYTPDDRVIELVFTTAASIAANLLAKKHLVGIQTNGFDPLAQGSNEANALGVTIRPEKGEYQKMVIMSTLGRLELTSTPPLAEYLNEISSRLPWTSATLLITHHLSPESAIILEGLKRGGFELAVIVVGEGETAETARERIASLHLPLACVPTEKYLGQLEFWQPERV